MIPCYNWFLDPCSARVWTVHAESSGSDEPRDSVDPDLVGLVLFGHNARVWDCCISDLVSFTRSLCNDCFLFFNNLGVKNILASVKVSGANFLFEYAKYLHVHESV